MSGAHTPGQWAFDPEDDTIVPSGETGVAICTLHPMDRGGDKGFFRGPITKANARLIAAAPEMAEVLREILEADDAAIGELDVLGMQADPRVTHLTEKARAVLASATGATTP